MNPPKLHGNMYLYLYLDTAILTRKVVRQAASRMFPMQKVWLDVPGYTLRIRCHVPAPPHSSGAQSLSASKQ